MSSSDLAAYLAENYLSSPQNAKRGKKSKQTKRKRTDAAAGLTIVDEDSALEFQTSHANDDKDDEAPVVVGSSSSTAHKSAGWKRLRTVSTAGTKDDNATADAIVASAAAEAKEAARRADEDAAPALVVVGEAAGVNGRAGAASADENADGGVQRMADGTVAGLQTAAAVAAQQAQQKQQDWEDWEREQRDSGAAAVDKAGGGETGYRDATGRRVDISAARQAAQQAAAEVERKRRRNELALSGDVQVEQARLRRQMLAAAKDMKVARTADDEEMNREMKETQRWNDPMAQFLTAKPVSSKGKGSKHRPVYHGHAPPNRYGIRPGYRWDGVDRGNGFESKRFKAISGQQRLEALEYEWEMDE